MIDKEIEDALKKDEKQSIEIAEKAIWECLESIIKQIAQKPSCHPSLKADWSGNIKTGRDLILRACLGTFVRISKEIIEDDEMFLHYFKDSK